MEREQETAAQSDRECQALPHNSYAPGTILAFQSAAGNRATTRLLTGTSANPVIQRSLLGDIWDGGVAAVSGLGDVLDDIGEASQAVIRALAFAAEITANPSRIVSLMAEVAWNELPDGIKARVIDAVLSAASVLVRNAPLPPLPPRFLWDVLRHGMAGFIDRVRTGYTADQKVRVADRMIHLWANPSADFTLGFLAGFAVGIWDGVSGPFVLLKDIAELQIRFTQLQMEFIRRLADDDARREIFAQFEQLANRVAALTETAWQEMLATQGNPLALLQMLDDFLQGILQGAEGIGGRMADAVMNFLQNAPDGDLGHALGRIEGNIVFEAVLLVLTSGGYTAIVKAVEGLRWVGQLMTRLSELRNAIRAAEVVELFAAQFSRITAIVRQSRVLSGIADALGEVLQALLKFLRVSYGLEGVGAAERGGARVAEDLGQAERRGGQVAGELEEGVRLARQLEGGGTLKYLENGRFVVCFSPCTYLEQRYAREIAELGRADDLRAIAGRMDAAAARGDVVAEEAAFDEAMRLEAELRAAHRQYLGTDVADAGGRFRQFEADAAEHIEQTTGRPLERLDPVNNPNHVNRSGDWFDPATRTTYDAVGPSTRFNFDEFTRSIEKHSVKTGLDVMWIDLSAFTEPQQQQIIRWMQRPEMMPFMTGARRPRAMIYLSPTRGVL